LYASSLKQSTVIPMEQRAANVKTGLEGGYIPNKAGLKRLYDDINDMNGQIAEVITDASIRGKAADTAGMQAQLSKIDKAIETEQKAAQVGTSIQDLQAHMVGKVGTQYMKQINEGGAARPLRGQQSLKRLCKLSCTGIAGKGQ